MVARQWSDANKIFNFNYDENNFSDDDNKNDSSSLIFQDLSRVNINQKYKYERKCHFRDTLQQFQGTQNKQINDKVYKDLEDMVLKHSLVDNTYDDIDNSSKESQCITKLID